MPKKRKFIAYCEKVFKNITVFLMMKKVIINSNMEE